MIRPAETIVAADEAEHAAISAELLARAVGEAVKARGVARIALSGGNTPALAYRELAKFDLPWAATEWYWVDERAVPPESPRSNFKNARENLTVIGDVVPWVQVHRMEAEDADLILAASRYEAVLRKGFGVASAVAFDVMTLGIGEDGHTASLFPGTGAVRIDDRLVAAIPAQPLRSLEARLTLTAPVICEARLLLVLLRGANKQPLISLAQAPGDEDEIPSRVIRRARGHVVWVLDRAAAGDGPSSNVSLQKG